jgi:hypothetical protein
MRVKRFLSSVFWLCVSLPAALCLTAVLAGAASAGTEVKIDSIADKYALQDFSFEVSPETGAAGIRLEYTYPPMRFGGDDSDRGPDPRIAFVPGLAYDDSVHEVVYNDGSTRTTCATQVNRTILFWKTVHMKPTGACAVSARVTHHAHDNGWNIDRFGTLDAFFEVHGK